MGMKKRPQNIHMQNSYDDSLCDEISYRTFFENAVEGLFLSTAGGKFIAVNPALAKMLGYDGPEEVIFTFQDLKSQLYVNPLDRDRLFMILKEKGKVTDFETQFICKDGSVKWINLAAREVRGEDGILRYIEGLNIDITARKNAEMALRESEKKFRRTFDQAPIGAAMVDLNFSFVRVNKVMSDITGYTEEELLSRKILDIIHPEDVSVGVGYANKLIKGEIDFYENDRRFIHKDGSVIWVNISMRCLRDQKGKPHYLLPMIQDITSRKSTLDALEATQNRLEYLLTANPAVIYSFILTNNGYTLTFISRNVGNLTGFDPDEFLLDPTLWERCIHPEDSRGISSWVEALRQQGHLTLEYRFRHKDGNFVWLRDQMRLSSTDPERTEEVVGFLNDITEQQIIKEKLLHSESIYRAIVEDQIEQVCRYKSDGALTFVNDAYAYFFQKAKEELVGTAFTLNMPDEDLKNFDKCLRNLSLTQPVTEIEHRVVLPDGQMRWLHRSVRAFFDRTGQISEYQVVGRDITDKVVAEQEIRRISDEKEQYRLNLEAVFSSIPDAVLTVDKDMRIIHINKAMGDICCISDKLVPGKSIKDFSGSCDRSCFYILFKTLQTKEPVIEYRLECTTSKPGKVFIINSSPLHDQDGKFMGAVLVIRDITRLANLEKQISSPAGYRNIIGKSKAMQEVYSVINLLTDVETTVLITGDSGTGKELIAEALHYGGPRAKRPLIKVNCSALAENLLESELFGHVRGAFTGAIKDKVGRFEAAEGGTLFLDEIGEVTLSTQLKLLRVLERKEYERVGDSKMLKADVRVITATNVDLNKQIRQGLFREDLYYRLKVMNIQLPPLREREQDIPLLCHHFINQLNLDYEKSISRISDEVMKLFIEHRWPGNVRELRHTLEHAFILCPRGEIGLAHLPKEFLSVRLEEKQYKTKVGLEKIIETLVRNGGNKAKAARELGIDRRTLYRNLDKK
jgi:PAS domain S-box-containing protein